MPYTVETMRPDDISEVMGIERESFTAVWPASAYRRELLENRLAHYLIVRKMAPEETESLAAGTVAEPSEPRGLRQVVSTLREWVAGPRSAAEAAGSGRRTIVGYLGLWMMVDEAHITTIAVRLSHRRQGVGELLLIAAVDLAISLGARLVTLEARVSNQSALALYEKFSFTKVGVRPRYYSDNNEDAVIMTSPDITSPAFQSRLRLIRARSQEKLGEVIWKH